MIILHKGTIYADLSSKLARPLTDLTHLITRTVSTDKGSSRIKECGYKSFVLGESIPTMPISAATGINHSHFIMNNIREISPFTDDKNFLHNNEFLVITNCKTSPDIFTIIQAASSGRLSFSTQKLDDKTETPMIICNNVDHTSIMLFCVDLTDTVEEAIKLYRSTFPDQFVRTAIFTKEEVISCLDTGDRFIPKIHFIREEPKNFRVTL